MTRVLPDNPDLEHLKKQAKDLVRGMNDGTPLHWAAWHGNIEMTRELRRRKPPLELTDGNNNATAMGWAVHGSLNGWHRATGDYAAVVTALLEAGAKPPEITADFEASEPVLEVLKEAAGK